MKDAPLRMYISYRRRHVYIIPGTVPRIQYPQEYHRTWYQYEHAAVTNGLGRQYARPYIQAYRIDIRINRQQFVLHSTAPTDVFARAYMWNGGRLIEFWLEWTSATCVSYDTRVWCTDWHEAGQRLPRLRYISWRDGTASTDGAPQAAASYIAAPGSRTPTAASFASTKMDDMIRPTFLQEGQPLSLHERTRQKSCWP